MRCQYLSFFILPLLQSDQTTRGLTFIERERSGRGNCPLCDVAIEAVCINLWQGFAIAALHPLQVVDEYPDLGRQVLTAKVQCVDVETFAVPVCQDRCQPHRYC